MEEASFEKKMPSKNHEQAESVCLYHHSSGHDRLEWIGQQQSKWAAKVHNKKNKQQIFVVLTYS